MTVNTSTSRAQYNGNGVTTGFSVPFRFLDNTHLKVIKTSSAGVDTALVLTTDYSVTGAGASSGTVTCVAAPASGEKLTIIRNMPFSQGIDLVNGDPLPAETLEAGLDARAMEAQQLNEALARSLTLSPTASGASTELPSPASSQLIGWDAGGTALQNYDSNALGISIATASWRTDKFNGTGAQTTFVLTNDAGVASNIDLLVNNVPQVADVNFSYTQSTKTITFLTGAPAAGTNNVVARYGSALSASNAVTQTSQVGAAQIPGGTTGQRDSSPQAGYFRYNSTLGQFEGYTASGWGGVGGANAGGVLYENSTTLSSNYTLTTGKNALMVGPLTVATGVTLTVPSGQRLVIL